MALCYLLGASHSFYYLKFKCFPISWKKKKVGLFRQLQNVLKWDLKKKKNLHKRFETLSSSSTNGSELVYQSVFAHNFIKMTCFSGPSPKRGWANKYLKAINAKENQLLELLRTPIFCLPSSPPCLSQPAVTGHP